MAQPAPLKPALYRAEGGARAPGNPALLVGECANCGYVIFPLQAYGCERCGGMLLEPCVLSGTGLLLASARVHIHHGKGREAPFTVGSIALGDGPIVRTLVVNEGKALHPGARVIITLVPVTDAEGAPRLDLRFIAES